MMESFNCDLFAYSAQTFTADDADFVYSTSSFTYSLALCAFCHVNKI